MATVSVSKQPYPLAATENPIIVELSTATSGSTETYALTTIKINNGVTGGVDWVQLTMSMPYLRGFRFNSSVSPSGPMDFLSSGFTLIFTPTTFTNEEIASSLSEAIRNEPTLSTYYSTYSTGDTVYITAKVATERLAIATTNITTLGNTIITTSSSGVKFTVTTVRNGSAKYQGDIETNYSMWADLYTDTVPSTATFTTATPLSGMTYRSPYRKSWIFQNNAIDFDLSGVLRSYCKNPPIPSGTTGFEGPYLDFTTNYKMVYGDYKPYGMQNLTVLLSGFPNLLKVNKGVVSGIACPSSLPFGTVNDMTGQYWTGGTTSTSKPMTTSPETKRVFLNQEKEYYYFFNNYYKRWLIAGSSNYTLTLAVDYLYIDNTTFQDVTGTTRALSVTTLDTKDGLYRVNVSPFALGIDADGMHRGKRVQQYSVFVYYGIKVIADLKTYVIEEVQPSTGVELVWINELGCHDSFYFGGNVVTSIDRSASSITKNVPYSYPEGFEYNANYDIKVYPKMTLSTSYIPEDHFNWLQSLASSSKIYRYDKDTNKLMFVTLDGDLTYEKDTVRNVYTVSLTIKETIYNNTVNF